MRSYGVSPNIIHASLLIFHYVPKFSSRLCKGTHALRTSFVFRRQHIGIAFLLCSGSLPGGGLPGALVPGAFLSFDGFIIQQDCCGKREELLWNCKLWHSYYSSANSVEIYGFSIRNSRFHISCQHCACCLQCAMVAFLGSPPAAPALLLSAQ